MSTTASDFTAVVGVCFATAFRRRFKLKRYMVYTELQKSFSHC
jgi:hypothetical protein